MRKGKPHFSNFVYFMHQVKKENMQKKKVVKWINRCSFFKAYISSTVYLLPPGIPKFFKETTPTKTRDVHAETKLVSYIP